MCIMASGKVVRSAVDEVSRTGRTTQGVTFAKPDKGDRILAVARNAERELDGDEAPAEESSVAVIEATGEVPSGSGASGDTAAPSADGAADAVALSDDDESEAQA